MLNNEYLIKEKYCPSKKMNVPVMVFPDVTRSPQCWDAAICNEDCSYSNRKNNDSKPEKTT